MWWNSAFVIRLLRRFFRPNDLFDLLDQRSEGGAIDGADAQAAEAFDHSGHFRRVSQVIFVEDQQAQQQAEQREEQLESQPLQEAVPSNVVPFNRIK